MKRVHKKGRKNNINIKWFVCLVLLVVLAAYCAMFNERIVRPNLAAIAEVEVKSMITRTVNNAVREQFLSDEEVRELLTIKTDQEGNITFVESNTTAMNKMATELTQKVQNQYQWKEPTIIDIPVGSIVGSQILSQIGPSVHLKVLPIGMSRANYRTEFESMGINQTKYKVYLEMESQARVLAPFSINNINVQNTILVAEAVIVGEVPEAYINVPAGSAMDATNFFPDLMP
jgi:sporulation protein YunB